MKFQYKALVAALALSVSSFAGAATTASGDGSFWLTLIDRDTSTAVSFETGLTYSTFNTIGQGAAASFTLPFTFDLSADSAFQSFMSTASSNLFYALYAGDNLGTQTSAGSRGMIISYDLREDQSVVTMSRTQLVTSNSAIDLALANNNMADYYSADKAAGNGATTIREVGEAMGLIQYTNRSTNATNNYIFADNNNPITVNFTRAGVLSISAVPETESYAMFMAGLGLMGAVVRRRKAAK